MISLLAIFKVQSIVILHFSLFSFICIWHRHLSFPYHDSVCSTGTTPNILCAYTLLCISPFHLGAFWQTHWNLKLFRHTQKHKLKSCAQCHILLITILPVWDWCAGVAADWIQRLEGYIVFSTALCSLVSRTYHHCSKMLWTGAMIFNIQSPPQMFHCCLMI